MRLALTPTDRRELQVLAERAGRPDLALKLVPDGRKAANRDEMARLRAAVFERAAGKGELCGKPLDGHGELCHLNGGIGRRQQRQSIENCVAEHPRCHSEGFDVDPLAWLERVRAWCDRYDYPLPERFRKLEALRGGR